MTTVSIGRAQNDARGCGMRSFARMMGAVVGLLCAAVLACPAVAWANGPTDSFHVEDGTTGADYPARYETADNGSGNSLVNASVELGDFVVIGGELGTDFDWHNGVLTVKTSTSIEILMKDGVNQTTNRILINLHSDNELAHVTLAGVTIRQTGSYAAMRIAMGSVDLVLKDGTQNELTSGANRAGLQKETEYDVPLTISGGGKLTATGGSSGAGIGGGFGSEVSSVVIAGGEIVATGGNYGAGIGGGNGAKANDITITGGSVAATGGSRAAGIGGGDGGLGNGVTITGGDVTAKGGSMAAGIGGGSFVYGSTSNDIIIKGGMVKAESGGQGAACIGSGYSGAYASIEITGGALSLTKVGTGPYLGSAGDDGSKWVDLKGGIFADMSTSVAANKVYGVAPYTGYVTAENTDDATKVEYPLSVIKEQKKGTITLKPTTTNLVYDGLALEAADVVAEAKYGNTPAAVASDVMFTHKSAGGTEQAGLPKDAGTYTITATLKAKKVGGVQYDEAKAEGEFTIAQAPLSVTANNHTITYGDEPAANGVAYDGFVNGETESSLQGALGYDITYSRYGVAGGSYAITPKGLTSANYAVEFKPGTLTVDKATAPAPTQGALSVKNGVAATYAYDLSQTLPALSGGLSFGDISYDLGAVSLGDYYSQDASVTNGILSLPVAAVDTAEEQLVGTVKATVHSQNYADFEVVVSVNAVNREVPQGSPTPSATTLTYGEALSTISLSGTFKNAAGEDVAGALAWDTPATLPEAGSYQAAWTFAPQAAETYGTARGTVTLAVAQKQVELDWSNTADRVYGDNKKVSAALRAGGVLSGDDVSVEVVGGDATEGGSHTATAKLVGDQAGNYKVSEASAGVTFDIAQSGSKFEEGSVQVLDAQGNVIQGAATFAYGEKVTVKAKPSSTGEKPLPQVSLLKSTEPIPAKPGQMALFYGEVQVSAAVDAGADGAYVLEYDTASGSIPVGTKVVLTAKYLASASMAEARATIELTVNPKVVELEWLNTTGRVAGDGKQVAANALGVLAGEDVTVTVEGGNATEAGTYTARAVSLAGAHAANYLLPNNASTLYEIAAKTPSGGDTPSGGGTGEGSDNAKLLAPTGDHAGAMAFAAMSLAAAVAAAIAVGRCAGDKKAGLKQR